MPTRALRAALSRDTFSETDSVEIVCLPTAANRILDILAIFSEASILPPPVPLLADP